MSKCVFFVVSERGGEIEIAGGARRDKTEERVVLSHKETP